MIPPWLVLAMVIGLAVAATYQLLTRRFGWRILLNWVLVLSGILVAEAIAESLGWDFTRVGDLRLLPDFLGAALVSAALWFLGI